jgi:regulator of sigma E protease
MTITFTLAAFLVAIGLLVTVHELGHYWAARWCDVKVLRFSIGFGKPLWMRRVGPDQTEWVIGALPLGGYVKMADERDASVDATDRLRAFNNKSLGQRSLIVAAGPAANFLLAAVFYWVLLVTGMPGLKPMLAEPRPGSPAALAGFRELEVITRIGDTPVTTWGEARLALVERASARHAVDIELQDQGERRYTRTIDLGGVTREDLDKDLFGKIGLNVFSGRAHTTLAEVVPQGAAARGGLRKGDRIVAIDGVPIARFEQVLSAVSGSAGRRLRIEAERDGALLAFELIPDAVRVAGTEIGRIGVYPEIDRTGTEALQIIVRAGPLPAAYQALLRVWDTSLFTLKMMGRMITGQVSWKNLSGPVTIADYAGQTAKLGWIPYVNFLALVSISLGVLNLLPIPVLDGGQLMYHVVEFFKGSPVSERAMQVGQQAGLALLLGLTAFAFYNDIHRLLTG